MGGIVFTQSSRLCVFRDRYYGLDDHMAIKDHDDLNEINFEIVMGYAPEQLCVRCGIISYSARYSERPPYVLLTTM